LKAAAQVKDTASHDFEAARFRNVDWTFALDYNDILDLTNCTRAMMVYYATIDADIVTAQANGFQWLQYNELEGTPAQVAAKQAEVFTKTTAAGLSLLFGTNATDLEENYTLFVDNCDALMYQVQKYQATDGLPGTLRSYIDLYRTARPDLPVWLQLSVNPPNDPTRSAINVLLDAWQIYNTGVSFEGFFIFYNLARWSVAQQALDILTQGIMALQITAVCNSIAALSVSGVSIADYDTIPVDCTRLTPVIFPNPENFVSGLEVRRDSSGSMATGQLTVEYTLTYRLCHSEVGAMRVNLEAYDAMVNAAFAFVDVVLDNDVVTGLVDLQVQDALNFGPVLDVAGNLYHGCDIALRVMEFVR